MCGRVAQGHGNKLNSSNNSMFLLQKSIEIGKYLISWCAGIRNLNEAQRASVKIYVTSSRTLVKSHKVFQKHSPQAVLEKSWSETFHIKITQKRLSWSPFLSYLTTCNFTEKEPHHSYFPMAFGKIFHVRTLVKQQTKLKFCPHMF